MLKKVLIAMFLISLLLGVFIYLWLFQIDRIGCGEKGKVLRVGNSAWTPLLQYCVTEYSDGGKSCKSSDECQGNCLTNADRTQAYCDYDDDSDSMNCEKKGSRIEICPLGKTDEPCLRECDIP